MNEISDHELFWSAYDPTHTNNKLKKLKLEKY